MKELTIKEIIKEINAEIIIEGVEMTCKTFSKDTRTLQKGDIYIAIKGQNFDGNKFWKQALEKGANCVIVSDISYTDEELKPYAGKTILKVKDTLEALYQIARLKRNKYKIPVIAVTGSVGKTSTKDIIASVI